MDKQFFTAKDLDIREQDGSLGKFAVKLVNFVAKKCIKDRSGAFFYKVANIGMGFNPSEDSAQDFVKLCENPPFCNTSSALKQLYKCCNRVLQNAPNLSEKLIFNLEKIALKKENDAENVRQIFDLSEKIMSLNPKSKDAAINLKKVAVRNLCLNHPQKGMEMISSMVQGTYPSETDLSCVYEGVSTVLSLSSLPKKAYGLLVEILEECSKSGYNIGDNAKCLSNICNTISRRTDEFNSQLMVIKSRMLKQKTRDNQSKTEQPAPNNKMDKIVNRTSEQYSKFNEIQKMR